MEGCTEGMGREGMGGWRSVRHRGNTKSAYLLNKTWRAKWWEDLLRRDTKTPLRKVKIICMCVRKRKKERERERKKKRRRGDTRIKKEGNLINNSIKLPKKVRIWVIFPVHEGLRRGEARRGGTGSSSTLALLKLSRPQRGEGEVRELRRIT